MEEIKAEIKPIEVKAEPDEFEGMTDDQISQKFVEEHTKLQLRFKRTFYFQPQLMVVKMEKMK
jgi:hypothetical protein